MGQPIDVAYVEILPDLSKFDRDAKKQLDRSLNTLTSDVDSAGKDIEKSLSGALEGAAKDGDAALKKVSKTVEDTAASVDKSMAQAREQVDRFGRTIREVNGVITITAVINGEEIVRTIKRDLSGKLRDEKGKFVSDFEKVGLGLGGDQGLGGGIKEGVTQSLGSLGKEISGIFTAVGTAVLPVLIGIGVELAGALGPAIVALGAALPAAAAIGGAAIGTLLIGFNGISDAVKNFDDIDKYNAALSKLAPAAQQVVQVLRNLRPVFADIQKAVQASLFAGLGPELKSVASTLAGPFKAGVTDIANAFNGLARGFGDFLKSSLGIDFVTTVLGTTANIIRDFTPAILTLAKAFASLTIAGTPFVELLAGKFATFLTGLGTKLSSAVNTGGLEKFFDNAVVSLEKVAVLGGQVFDIILKLLTAAGPSGTSLLDTLVSLTAQLDKFVSTKEGIRAFALIFSAFGTTLDITLGFVTLATKAIFAIGDATRSAVIWVKGATKSVEEFGTSVGHWFSGAFDSVRKFFDGVGKWFSELPGKIGNFLSAIPGVLEHAFLAAFNAVLTDIGIQIGLILAAFLVLPGKIIDTLQELPGLWSNFLSNLWTSIWSSITTFWDDTVVPFFIALPARILAAVSAFTSMINNFLIGLWNNISTNMVAGFNAVVAFIQSIPDRIAKLAGQFAAAGVNLIKGFINGISSGGDINKVAGSIVGAIKGFLNGTIDRINGGINGVGASLHVKLPNIPRLAAGGIATAATTATVGEAGDEAVLPLSGARGKQTFQMIADAATGGGTTINFAAGSVAVSFEGVIPTQAQATQTGEAVGLGIASILAKRDARTRIRTA